MKFKVFFAVLLLSGYAYAESYTQESGSYSPTFTVTQGDVGQQWLTATGLVAYVASTTTVNSSHLYLSGFNFTLPENSVILGITVNLEGFCNHATNDHCYHLDEYHGEATVKLLKSGAPIGESNFSQPLFGTDAHGGVLSNIYGNSSYTWGGYWTPEELNDNRLTIDLQIDLKHAGALLLNETLKYVNVSVRYETYEEYNYTGTENEVLGCVKFMSNVSDPNSFIVGANVNVEYTVDGAYHKLEEFSNGLGRVELSLPRYNAGGSSVVCTISAWKAGYPKQQYSLTCQNVEYYPNCYPFQLETDTPALTDILVNVSAGSYTGSLINCWGMVTDCGADSSCSNGKKMFGMTVPIDANGRLKKEDVLISPSNYYKASVECYDAGMDNGIGSMMKKGSEAVNGELRFEFGLTGTGTDDENPEVPYVGETVWLDGWVLNSTGGTYSINGMRVHCDDYPDEGALVAANGKYNITGIPKDYLCTKILIDGNGYYDPRSFFEYSGLDMPSNRPSFNFTVLRGGGMDSGGNNSIPEEGVEINDPSGQNLRQLTIKLKDAVSGKSINGHVTITCNGGSLKESDTDDYKVTFEHLIDGCDYDVKAEAANYETKEFSLPYTITYKVASMNPVGSEDHKCRVQGLVYIQNTTGNFMLPGTNVKVYYGNVVVYSGKTDGSGYYMTGLDLPCDAEIRTEVVYGGKTYSNKVKTFYGAAGGEGVESDVKIEASAVDINDLVISYKNILMNLAILPISIFIFLCLAVLFKVMRSI